MTESKQPAISASNAFDLLAKNTEITPDEYTLITQNQTGIEHSLAQHLSTFSTVLYGAFSRRIIVSPLAGSIVDMFVVCRQSDVKNTLPYRVFRKLSDSLIRHYADAYMIENKSV